MLQGEPLVTNTFKGRRFDDHGLDLDVLPEIIIYHKILVETAKELWRKNNPDKQRLKKNLEDTYGYHNSPTAPAVSSEALVPARILGIEPNMSRELRLANVVFMGVLRVKAL